MKHLLDYTFLDLKKDPSNFVCLIVLNQKINKDLFLHLYSLADYKIYADGGSNSIQGIFGENGLEEYSPDIILGDFDSINQKTKSIIEKMGVQIAWKPDENYTDSEKSLMHFEDEIFTKNEGKLSKVVILGAFGGRMDHTLYNLHLLWKKITQPELKYDLFMFDDLNLVTGIKAGKTLIKYPINFTKQKGCGLVTMGKCDTISTKGLKYNMGILKFYFRPGTSCEYYGIW